jgi:hypothetical protein
MRKVSFTFIWHLLKIIVIICSVTSEDFYLCSRSRKGTHIYIYRHTHINSSCWTRRSNSECSHSTTSWPLQSGTIKSRTITVQTRRRCGGNNHLKLSSGKPHGTRQYRRPTYGQVYLRFSQRHWRSLMSFGSLCLVDYSPNYQRSLVTQSSVYVLVGILTVWRWRQQVPPKVRQTFTSRHGVICQEAFIFHKL